MENVTSRRFHDFYTAVSVIKSVLLRCNFDLENAKIRISIYTFEVIRNFEKCRPWKVRKPSLRYSNWLFAWVRIHRYETIVCIPCTCFCTKSFEVKVGSIPNVRLLGRENRIGISWHRGNLALIQRYNQFMNLFIT